MRTLAVLACLAAAVLACGRVPEQSLRDEQARSRRYRDAYESELQRNQELRKRLAESEQRTAVCPPAAAESKPAEQK